MHHFDGLELMLAYAHEYSSKNEVKLLSLFIRLESLEPPVAVRICDAVLVLNLL
jgi:hypothetical protein